jgi:hypothetical protein
VGVNWTGKGRYFPEKRIKLGLSPNPSVGQPMFVPVPAVQSQSVAAGATQEIRQSVSMILTSLSFAIPEGVTGFIELDGERVHSSQDSEGETGGLPFGDPTTRQGRSISQVRVSFTNTTSGALDAKYVLHGVPF